MDVGVGVSDSGGGHTKGGFPHENGGAGWTLRAGLFHSSFLVERGLTRTWC